jgi:hypothetical protein
VSPARFVHPHLYKAEDLQEEYFKWLRSTPSVKPMLEAWQALLNRQQDALLALHAAQAGSTPWSNLDRSKFDPVNIGQLPPGGVPSMALGAAVAAGEQRVPGGPISSLCEVPFLLSADAKSRILRDEAQYMQQQVGGGGRVCGCGGVWAGVWVWAFPVESS